MDGNRWRFFKKPVNTQFKRKGASISCRKGKYEELSENYLDDDTVYRTLCPSKKIGGVIGKGGKNALLKVHDWIVEDDDNEINAVTARLLVQQGKTLGIDVFMLSTGFTARFCSEFRLLIVECSSSDLLDLDVHHIGKKIDGSVPGISRYAIHNLNPLSLFSNLHPDYKCSLFPLEKEELHMGGWGDSFIPVVITRVLEVNIYSELDWCITYKSAPVLPGPSNCCYVERMWVISGKPAVAKRALYEISTLLHQNLCKEPPSVPIMPPMPWIGEFGDHPPEFGPGGFNGSPPGHGRELSAEFSMKILCSTGKIGKGSSNFKVIEQEAGASIHVEDASAKSEEHAIRVFTFEVGLLEFWFCQVRLAGILGQGGQDINEMRRLEADIHVYPKNEKPKCASEDDELLLISGNYGVATDVLDIASRLGARTLHDENARVELECAGPVLGFSLAHNLPGIGPLPSLMMGASSSGGYEPLKKTSQQALQLNIYPQINADDLCECQQVSCTLAPSRLHYRQLAAHPRLTCTKKWIRVVSTTHRQPEEIRNRGIVCGDESLSTVVSKVSYNVALFL
ncbi:hypothetical protein DKX38_006064 [Salix brachista]|uniref:K Homology domain-containing protein n=1 Tax=Salix brachista TaxID=2182728 RepID=A0A5N5N1A0_9ROSI|nr:hypothetical protein DKX38_006064 [Salix brachista]